MLKWFSKRKTAESSVKLSSSPHSSRQGEIIGGNPSTESSMESRVNYQNQDNENSSEVSYSSDLTDADYEFLFNQLLDGVAHGWNQIRIIKFFQALGTRGEERYWVAWLSKFSTKIPDVTNDSQRRLGAIMLRLAEVTQSAAELTELSRISAQIGKKLFFGKTANLIWEYDGLDVVAPLNSAIDDTIEDGDSSRAENITSISEPIPESPVEASSEPEKIASPSPDLSTKTIPESPVEASSEPEKIASPSPDLSTKTIPESPVEASSELEKIASPSPDLSTTAIPESSVEASSELEKIASPSPESSTTAIPESPEVTSSHIASTEPNLSENQDVIPNPLNQPETTEENSVDPEVLELVESWFNLGLKQVSTEDFHGAIDSWQKALKLNPHLAEIWHNLGSALGRLEKYPEAIESFNKALEIDPQSYQAWNDRAHAFYQMHQWEEAIASWDKAIAINPGNYQFWYHRGCALEHVQSFDEAIASYEKTLEISPDFQPARSRYVNLVTKS